MAAERIAVAQEIPLRFLDTILTELRYAGLVRGRTGAEGGYWLARPPEDITLAEIIREVDGPLGSVHGEPPDELTFLGDAKPLQEVWIALRANMREVLESVTHRRPGQRPAAGAGPQDRQRPGCLAAGR